MSELTCTQILTNNVDLPGPGLRLVLKTATWNNLSDSYLGKTSCMC